MATVKLGFLRHGAHTRAALACRAAGAVLFRHGFFEIDAGDVGESGQPGEHVRELMCGLGRRAAAQRRRQFADFLHEPHERAIDASARVLGAEGFAYHRLQFGESH